MKNREEGIFLSVGVLVFIFLPICLDQVIMNRFVTNWKLNEWAGFLGSYLGGAIGGIIALLGVYYQLKKSNSLEKEKKMNKFKRISEFSFKQIQSDEFYDGYNFLFLKKKSFFMKKDFFYEVFIEKYEEEIANFQFYDEFVLFNLKKENYKNKIEYFNQVKENLNIEIETMRETIENKLDIKLKEIENLEKKISEEKEEQKLKILFQDYVFVLTSLLKDLINREKQIHEERIKKEAEDIEKIILEISDNGKKEINSKVETLEKTTIKEFNSRNLKDEYQKEIENKKEKICNEINEKSKTGQKNIRNISSKGKNRLDKLKNISIEYLDLLDEIINESFEIKKSAKSLADKINVYFEKNPLKK